METVKVGGLEIITCLDRTWYDTAVEQLIAHSPSWDTDHTLYTRLIRRAIHDEVHGNPDPTLNGFNAKPANRTWSELLRDETHFKPTLGPITGQPAFVFQTYVTRITQLNWGYATSSTNPNQRFWYPIGCVGDDRCAEAKSGIWKDGDFINPPPGCNAFETLPQSYMRHLREIYEPDAFKKILEGKERELPFNLNNIRFGASGSQPSIHFHVLAVEGSVNKIVELRWYTYRFERNLANNEPIEHIPINRDEFIVTSGGQPVQPLVCP